MHDSFLLSQGKLATFFACQRRFQLRYLRRLPWPAAPLDDQTAASLERGQQFHQLLQRHFLHLPIEPAAIVDETVRRWWSLFARSWRQFPELSRSDNRFLTEISLTVPIGDALLNGRFDLLVIGTAGATPFAHLFDWKTGKAHSEADLRQSWQTRLYLALLAAGGTALLPSGKSLSPAQIAITYWYVTEPDTPRTIQYSAAWHKQNWDEIQAVVAQITAQWEQERWPLTEDWSLCQACAYQTYCGRQGGGSTNALAIDDDTEPTLPDWSLEPDLP